MHVPEPALQRGGFSCGRGGKGMRVDADQREVPEGELEVPVQLTFDLLDRVERLPRIRALVVAVLEDQRAAGRAADVIGFLHRRQGQLARRPQKPTCWRMRTRWIRPGSSWWISRTFAT
jgi:hypothetical protein